MIMTATRAEKQLYDFKQETNGTTLTPSPLCVLVECLKPKPVQNIRKVPQVQ